MSGTKLRSLNDVFSQSFFRIPDFQRGYSWGKEQLNDFWEDVFNLKAGNVHYTGMLTVEEIHQKDINGLEKWSDDLWLFEKGYKAYYVVDGQQRLTTIIILLNEILDRFEEEEGINFSSKSQWILKFLYSNYSTEYKSYLFGYEKDDPSDEYFKTKVLGQHSSYSDKVPEQTLYTYNLAFAQSFFKERLDVLDKEALEGVFKKVVNSLKFNFYEIDDDLDIYVTFETMNNRGKDLSTLELLKNRLIYLSTLLQEDDLKKNRLRKDINEVWKTIYAYLGKNKDNRLIDDDFLRDHWIMYYKYDRSISDAYAQFLLKDKFTAKAVLSSEVDFSDIKKYIDSLSASIKAWFYLFNINTSIYNDELKEWIQKLNRLTFGAFIPTLVAAFVKEKDEMKILDLVKAIERFNFLVFRISQRQSNTKNSHFYRLANMYYHDLDFWGYGPTKIEEVILDVKYLTDGVNENGNNDGWLELEKFEHHIKDLFNKKEGYYSWNGLRYFLYEYELYLRDIAKGNTKVTWDDFNKRKKEDTIEHIYPQTANKREWKIAFKGVSAKRKDYLLHSLGNLLLLSRVKNSEFQNNIFDHKKKHINKDNNEVGFFNGSYSEIEVASNDDWTPKEIEERGVKMLGFLEERWNVSFEEANISKTSILFLE